MSASRKASDPAQVYSSGITRRLCHEAGSLIDAGKSLDDVTAELTALTGDLDAMTDGERSQLREVLQLLTAAEDVPIPVDLNAEGQFATQLSADRMFLLLSVRPPIADGRAVEARAVVDRLREMGLRRGVDMAAIHAAVKRAAAGETVDEVVIVKGAPPTPGRDGEVRFFARRRLDEALSPVSQATLESAQQAYWMCREGDRIGKIVAPQPGRPGYDAAGRPLPPPAVHAADVSVGRFVQRERDELIATASGVVRLDAGALTVVKTLVLQGDLTSRHGPIVFDGDVHVHGVVRAKASIRATGEIVVCGSVEAATVESTGGDVTLLRGIAGQGRGTVRAAGNITARFAEQASLCAGGDVHLQLGTMHSRVQAGGTISAVQGKGQLIGGTLIAGRSVTAKQLGAQGESQTQVIVGLSAQTLQQIDALGARRAEHLEKQAEVTELAEQMVRLVGDPQKLTPTEKVVYGRLRQVEVLCQRAVRRLDAEINALASAEDRQQQGTVRVYNELQPGVDISIGAAKLKNTQSRGPCTLSVDKQTDRIRIDSRTR